MAQKKILYFGVQEETMMMILSQKEGLRWNYQKNYDIYKIKF